MSRRIVFVCRSATGEALRCANAIKKLEGVFVEIICVDDIPEPSAVDRSCEGLGISTACHGTGDAACARRRSKRGIGSRSDEFGSRRAHTR